ncbi:M23 family metallopeptidase [Arthrobacter sp. TMN-37]
MTTPALPGRRRASAAVPRITSARPASTAAPVSADPAIATRRSLRSTPEPQPTRRRDVRHSAAAGAAPAGILPRLRAGALAVGLAAVGAGLVMGAVPAPASTEAGTPVTQAAAAESLPSITADSAAEIEFTRQGVAGVQMAKSGAKATTLASDITKAEDGATLAAPLDNLTVASTFGYRVNPLGGYAPELHTGIDYAGACGTPVMASGGGVVVDAGWHAYGGGQRVVIDHGKGLKSTYNHLSSIGVSAGQKVERGGLIGAVGTTGNSTGCHLHFEVLVNDEKVDPLPWL